MQEGRLALCFAVKFASACFMGFLCLEDDIVLVITVVLRGLKLCLTVEVTMSWLLTTKSIRLHYSKALIPWVCSGKPSTGIRARTKVVWT